MNNPFSRIPGLSLAQGLQAGFQAAGTGLQNVDTINKLSEWNKNAAIRDLQRAAAQDQLTTNNQLNAASNQALLGIQKLRSQLYSSPDGYLQALNQISPVGQGFTRRLSSDGKTIETVNPLGAVVGTTPNYTGKAAENALLNAGGISLAARAQQLPQQEEADAKNQTALMVAKMHGDAQRDVALYGLRAARAAAAGAARGLGPDNVPKLTPEDSKKLHNALVQQFDALNGYKLPWNKDGTLDTSMMQGNKAAADLMADYTSRANRILLKSAQYGVQPAIVAANEMEQYRQELGNAALAQAASGILQQRTQQHQRDWQMNQPTQPLFQNTNPYSANAPMRFNPNFAGDVGEALKPFIPNVLQQQVPMQQVNPAFLQQYGDPTGETYIPSKRGYILDLFNSD